jgi:hypothetical protein
VVEWKYYKIGGKMFQLGNGFLEDMGLSGMPAEQKKEFLAHVQEELEERVGERMAEGVSDELVEEFERIINGDKETIDKILADVGDYKGDEVYRVLVEKGGLADGSPEMLGEYASMKWLMKNRPDYQEIVGKVLDELGAEVKANKDAILGGDIKAA